MIDTHHLIIEFGKYKGEHWTRIPISYLRWITNNVPEYIEIAEAELERRGTILERKVEISAHAIDSASLRHLKKWERRPNKKQGLHAWLHDQAWKAWKSMLKDPAQKEKILRGGKIKHNGISFAFEPGLQVPTLLTVT